jgi:hypothetical protein
MQAKIIDFFENVPMSRHYEILDRLKQTKIKADKKALKILKTPLSKREKI